MQYFKVYLRNVRDLYTWQSEENLQPGARVIVKFRNQKRFGIIVKNVPQPEFKTLPIVETLDSVFLSENYLNLASAISAENFTTFGKVLNLMIPEAFLSKMDPVKRQISYRLISPLNKGESKGDLPKIRGEKQQLAVQLLQENNGTLSAKEIRAQIPLATLKTLLEKNIIEQNFGSIKPAIRTAKNPRKNFELKPKQAEVFANVMTNEKPSLIWGVTGSGKTEIYKKLADTVMTKNPDAQILFLVPEIALSPQLIADFQSLFGDQVAIWHSNLTANEKVQEWARINSGQAKILIGTRSAVLVPMKNPQLIILDEEHEWTFKNEFAPRYWTHDIAEKIWRQMTRLRENENTSTKKSAEKLTAPNSSSLIPRPLLVFGSATPRLESLQKCYDDAWNLERLPHRVHQTQDPDIKLINLTNEGKKGNHTPLSEDLVKALKDIKRRGKQAVLFLNKRGFSGSTMCKACGTYFECPNCSANMKLHRNAHNERLICHTCGHMEGFPDKCPHCSTNNFVFRGWGTQQVEAEIKAQLPELRFIRADADTVTGRYDFELILDRFHAKEADVLLGTQMIAKGLDFEDVELVGVILADVGLSLPDFRSEERVFQLMTQVAGRAGRRKTPGKILIQTFHPEDDIFTLIKHHKISEFFDWQLELRAKNHLPPFACMAKITLSDADKGKAFNECKKLYEQIKQMADSPPSRGSERGSDSRQNPTYPPLKGEEQKSADFSKTISDVHFAPAFFPRSHNRYHFHVIIKADNEKNLRIFLEQIKFPGNAKIDLNPVSLL